MQDIDLAKNVGMATAEQLKDIRNQALGVCNVAIENFEWLEGIMKSVSKLDDRESIESLGKIGIHLTGHGLDLVACMKGKLEKTFAEISS